MNLLNRIVTIILLIFVVVFSILTAVNKFTDLFVWTDVSNRIIGSLAALDTYLLAGVLIALAAICILIIFLEFYRRKVKVAKLSEDDTGSEMVTLKALNYRIEKSLSKIENMSNLKVRVASKKEGLLINMYAKISRGINVENKIVQIREKASEFVTRNIGFKVLKTNLTITGFTDQKKIRSEERKAEKEKESGSRKYPG